MERASIKLSFLIFVIVAFASFLSPLTAEARRHKHIHRANCHHRRGSPSRLPPPTSAPISEPAVPPSDEGIPPYQTPNCGDPCSDSNDCYWPCTICCANQTCCYDEPFITSPLAPSPNMEAPPFEQPLVPAPAPAPNKGIDVEIPPYEIHGCGYPCNDSNDCDWPCTVCGANQTCAFDEPFSEAPPPYEIHGCGYPCNDSNDCDWPCTVCGANQTCAFDEPFSEAPPPYEIHGCGYPCNDSNDCDWPCTICGANQTCAYDEPFLTSPPAPPITSPSPAPSPLTGAPTPPWVPNNGIPPPPYQIHGCGYPCSDSNDCDAPCTICGANYTCVYDVPEDEYMLPPMSSFEPPKLVPLPPSQPPSTEDKRIDDMLAPQPSYDTGVSTELPPSSGYEFPPYQVHDCGYGPCTDSIDCNWPCSCCANQTCCYEGTMFP